MAYYLLINNATQVVEGVVVWDGISAWSPGNGYYIEAADGTVQGGWQKIAGVWTDMNVVGPQTAIPDGTYTMGLGLNQDGTVTFEDGAPTDMQEAS